MIQAKRSDYEFISRIASGRYTDVYKAKHSPSNSLFAIKTVIPIEEVAPHCSRRELKTLTDCDHVNIIKPEHWFEYSEDGDLHLGIVLPYLPFTLTSMLAKHRKANYPPGSGWRNSLSTEIQARIVGQIAAGLEYLHARNYIHRDIKPENILVQGYNAEDCVVKIIDLGTAWIPNDNGGAEPANAKVLDVGTGCYRAPEVLFGKADYGVALDIWGLGCIAAKLASKDSSRDLFGPYISDIGLICNQFGILGAPSSHAWPEMAHSFTFSSMHFAQPEGTPLTDAELAPLGSECLRRATSGCLQFQSTDRWTAGEVYECMLTELEDDPCPISP